MNGDVDIREWNVSYSPGIMLGIGAVAVYELSPVLSLQGELSYNYQHSKIKIDYLEDNRVSGNGETETINSEAKISSSRLALPVTINYSLGLDKPVLIAGFEMNFLGTPDIESVEIEEVKSFENNNLVAQDPDAEAITGDLDEFNKTRLNFLLGVGKTIEMGENKLSLQLKYHLPLTYSIMHNNNASILFDDNTKKNNEVFGAQGKIDAEQDAP